MIQRTVKRIARRYYRPGSFYTIPFGRNAGRYFEYDESIILGMMLGLHEPNTFEAGRQVIREGMTVLDIGANRGYFSIFFDSLFGDSGMVLSFEPMPDNFSALQRTIEKNNCRRTLLFQKAVSNSVSTETIFPGENHLMASLVGSWAGSEHGSFTVETITIDGLFEAKEKGPDFIKMDIEGGGVFALPGMDMVIREFRPALLIESHTPQEDRAIGDVLRLGNYSAFRIGSRVPIENLHADYTDSRGVYGTILAVPRGGPAESRLKPDLFQKRRFGQR